MALLRTRHALAKDLREGIRLLLPEDPGRDRMLETVRLFDTHARHVMGHRIAVDLLEDIHLTSPEAIDPEIAAEAGVPPGMTVAYFAQVTTHAATADKRDSRQRRSYQAMLLVNGLAQRLGGVAWPVPDELSEPTFATVFFIWSASLDKLAQFVARTAPEPRPCSRYLAVIRCAQLACRRRMASSRVPAAGLADDLPATVPRRTATSSWGSERHYSSAAAAGQSSGHRHHT